MSSGGRGLAVLGVFRLRSSMRGLPASSVSVGLLVVVMMEAARFLVIGPRGEDATEGMEWIEVNDDEEEEEAVEKG